MPQTSGAPPAPGIEGPCSHQPVASHQQEGPGSPAENGRTSPKHTESWQLHFEKQHKNDSCDHARETGSRLPVTPAAITRLLSIHTVGEPLPHLIIHTLQGAYSKCGCPGPAPGLQTQPIWGGGPGVGQASRVWELLLWGSQSREAQPLPWRRSQQPSGRPQGTDCADWPVWGTCPPPGWGGGPTLTHS